MSQMHKIKSIDRRYAKSLLTNISRELEQMPAVHLQFSRMEKEKSLRFTCRHTRSFLDLTQRENRPDLVLIPHFKPWTRKTPSQIPSYTP